MERDLRAIPGRGEPGVCCIAAAAVAAVATIGGAVISGNAAKDAAKTQVGAANNATATQKEMYDLTRGDLQPYNLAGQGAEASLMGRLGELTSPVVMDQRTLEQTPGYQFTRTQGLKSVQNSATARGLGVSGAALKGGAAYATGLADNTYQHQFENAWANKLNPYNMLMGTAQLGEDAAAKTGNVGSQTANAISNAQIGAGNAAAGGIIGAANATSGAFNNLGALGLTYGMYGGFNPSGGAGVPLGSNGIDGSETAISI